MGSTLEYKLRNDLLILHMERTLSHCKKIGQERITGTREMLNFQHTWKFLPQTQVFQYFIRLNLYTINLQNKPPILS